jgi:hypothetical protein
MKTLTKEQHYHLQSFYFAMYCYYIEGIQTDFKYWADKLDALNISFNVQNNVAYWSTVKENNSYYLSALLKDKLNIIILNN